MSKNYGKITKTYETRWKWGLAHCSGWWLVGSFLFTIDHNVTLLHPWGQGDFSDFNECLVWKGKLTKNMKNWKSQQDENEV